MEPLALALVGRTGTGKSATGNSILGKERFVSHKSAASVTMTCEIGAVRRPDGRVIRVVDTPGFFEVGRSTEDVKAEIGNCVGYVKDGIHAMLLVLSTRNRLTKEEMAVVESMQDVFGTKVWRFAILVFTAADELEGQTLEDFCEEGPEALEELLIKCGRRMIAFENKAMGNLSLLGRLTDASAKERQVTELLRIVDNMVRRNGGKPYTNELFQQAKLAAEKQREEQQKLETARAQAVEVRLLKQQMELEMAKRMKSLTDEMELRIAQAEARAIREGLRSAKAEAERNHGLERDDAIMAIQNRLRHMFPKHNVMVCHPHHVAHLENSTHIHMELRPGFWGALGGTLGVDVYVFTHGTFTLLGDGGYINWCFGGKFVRDPPDSKTIIFKQIK